MACDDFYEFDRAVLITTLEVGSAVRHETLNRLELCQMELLLLRGELKGSAEIYGQRIEAISREISAIAAALNRFRSISGTRSKPTVVAMANVFDEAVAALGRSEFEKVGVEIVIDGGDLKLEIDSEALRAAFIQLLINSLGGFRRARQRGGFEIRVSAARVSQTGCQIIYRDNGPGIDTAQLGIQRNSSHALVSDQVFSPSASSSGAPDFGLWIAKMLLEGLGGDIALIPSSDGVQFKLELPVTSTPR